MVRIVTCRHQYYGEYVTVDVGPCRSYRVEAIAMLQRWKWRSAVRGLIYLLRQAVVEIAIAFTGGKK